MTSTVKVRFNDEVVLRSVRRIHRKDNGLEYGWASLGGRDTKVVRRYRKRIWCVAR